MTSNKHGYSPILIVDDEEQILLAYDTALRMSGYASVLTCSDPRQVLEMAKEHAPELILLDLMMPHISGQALLKQIASDFPDVSVIVITGVDDVPVAVECVKAGAVDYLVKPIDRGLLIAAVDRAFTARDEGWTPGKGSGSLPTIREATDALVDEAMRRADHKQSGAAKLLGITQPALSQRLKRRRDKSEEQGKS